MAEALLTTVLEKVGSFIGKKLSLFLNFDQDLERLSSSLTAIIATLEDAEEKQFSDRAIKNWLRKLKDAAHDLDDIMDDFAYEEMRLEREGVRCCLSQMVSSFLPSFHPMHVCFRYKIAKEMKRVSERLDAIAEERNKFHLIQTAPERTNTVTDLRQTGPVTNEPQVYGRKEETEKVVDFLVGDASHSEDLSVYPILGIGGLGKTTLAQLIYKHERIVDHFELRIWVCVSEDFSFKRMAKAIIEAATERACEDLDVGPLQIKLQNLLRSKRYLLVLDDVWDDKQENWQRLRSILVCGAKGASILVTTRLSKVAEIMGTRPPQELTELSSDDCWELFKNRAFGPNEAQQVNLVAIGKEIVMKCGGVPLAAKALGGILRFQRDVEYWNKVKKNNMWSLPDNENSIMPALKLSYLNLPIKLRQCFAYCAIFPKDERIEKQYLIELWMANGFVSSNETLDAEYVWNELYWRSFFQDIKTDAFGRVTFNMHDLVHDLAQFVAEDVCCITDDDDVTTLSARIYHLSHITWRNNINPILVPKVKHLRTYRCNEGLLNVHVLECYSLRVFHLKGIKELPPSIGHLKHLRYLNLSLSSFKTLPESLGTLWNLQILNLDHCHKLQLLPNSLILLKDLQKLSFGNCWELYSLPPQMGKLTSLRSLTMYSVGKEKGLLLAELGALKLEGDLIIKHLEKVKSVKDAEEANMSSKQLSGLRLSWEINEEWELQENVEEILDVLQPNTQQLKSLIVEGYKGFHFPQWMSNLPSLHELKLRKLPKLESLPDCLENLPSLHQLYLDDLPKLESLPDCLGNLPSLHQLHLENLPKLESLPDCLGNLSSLHQLTLSYLPELESLPDCLGNLPSLHELHLENLPKLESLPDCLGNLPSLHQLYLWNLPELESLPDCLGNLPSLHQLRLWVLPKLESLPDCLGNLPSLHELHLENLPKLESLPDCLGNLPSLHELHLENLPKLESLPDCLGNLPSLHYLHLENLPKLESLPDCLGNLPSLHQLRLWVLPKLESLPDCLGNLPSLHELHLENLPKLESLPDCLGNLPSLHELHLENLPKLESLPDCLGNLPSLHELYLENLPKLESLPDCLGNLPSLHELHLKNLPKLESLPDCLGNLPSLHLLRLWVLPKLESLPDCLGNLPSLHQLSLLDLPKLESLPDCFGNFPLLRRFQIYGCSMLRCLPMSLSLSRLQSLRIVGCDGLTKRCMKETGEDWPKIAHIPEVYVSGL